MNYSIDEIKEIIGQFTLEGTLVSVEPIDAGHINRTYRVDLQNGDTLTEYLLQRVNTEIFKNPDELMENIDRVTDFLRKKIEARGGNPERETLYCKPCVNGKKYYTDAHGGAWRVYNYITDSFSYDAIDSPEIFYNAGFAFGDFQGLLADFPIDSLHETIPNFHNTAIRYSNLMCAVKNNLSGRAASVEKEIAFASARKDETYILIGKALAGILPMRVTHNDTKLNNIMFDKAANKPICVVDLDTVMPGLSLYDFGDAIRFGANTASEDEKDLSAVKFDLGLYEQYVRGYLTSAGASLSREEVELMPFAAKMMTLECGMRFLTDYIDGDIYFKTAYPEHNLDRCHTQFKLVEEMEKSYEAAVDITMNAYKEICGK